MKVVLGFLLLCIVPFGVEAQSPKEDLRIRWSQPIDPFRVIGNIYYVGTTGISSHIIATSEGLILLDTGTTAMSENLQANIKSLGFAVTDIKYIISSHAHWDHVEGHAAIKAAAGAQIVALDGDAQAIASGVDTSALGGEGWQPVVVDRIILDGDAVSLGGVTLIAHRTAGHTKGCTSWTVTIEEDGTRFDVIFVGGTSVNEGVRLNDNARHSSIAEDYAATFAFLESQTPDVFIAQHPFLYGMTEKRQAVGAKPGVNPFINPAEFHKFVAEQKSAYLERLQQSAQ
ncbi:MAG: subclass B3 metallo-beta-lactamase [Kordiimonadaceae bacterium]|nr:subclass B3 metallo-beta-lactamase [Kordiimonadaceae bacterium]